MPPINSVVTPVSMAAALALAILLLPAGCASPSGKPIDRLVSKDESRKLAAKSERGRLLLALGSSHHIHLDAPELFIDAVHEMLFEQNP